MSIIPAFSISILVTAGIILFFHLTKLAFDPFFYQLELILLLFSVSLTGILTRSKLKSLANAIVAFFAWTMTLLDSRMPWAYGKRVGELGKDFVEVMERLSGEPGLNVSKEDLSTLNLLFDLATIFDLITIMLLALIFGFFCAVIATGFYNKDGEFSRITIATKPLALLFVLLILPLPIAYHGVGKVAESSLALATGAALLSEQANEIEEAGEASIENITAIAAVFEEAQEYFDISRKAFDEAEENFLFPVILDLLGDQEIQSEVTLSEIAEILDPMLAALFYLGGAGPSLYGGVAYLMEGLVDTLRAMGMHIGLGRSIMQKMSTRSPGTIQSSRLNATAFDVGVSYLEDAISYFDSASDDVLKAYGYAESIFGTTAYQKLTVNTDDYTADALKALELIDRVIPLAISMSNSTIFFAKTTYALLQATEDLQDNNFEIARDHLDWATDNATETDSIVAEALGTIDLNFKNNELTNAFWGGIRALANMTSLTNFFINAAKYGTDTLVSVNQTLDILSTINLNASVNDPEVRGDWLVSGTNINWAASNNSLSAEQVGTASQLASDMKSANYGNLNGTMHDSATGLHEEIGENATRGFWGNLTDFGVLLKAANHTHLAFWSYAIGFAEYTEAGALFNATGDWGPYPDGWSQEYLDTMNNASYWFGLSNTNASAGADTLAVDPKIDPATQQALEDTLEILKNETALCQDLTQAAANGSTTPILIADEMESSLKAVNAAQGELANTFATREGLLQYTVKQRASQLLEAANGMISQIAEQESKHFELVRGPLGIFFAFILLQASERHRKLKALQLSCF
ncbi:MAG: hypothetical protein ACFFGZ_16120 [Candidatus Thorarchaeota archaeon]